MQSREKLTLGMDTSGSPLLLTVKKGDKIFSVRRKGVKQEKLLFPALESLLAKAGAQMEDIGQIFIIRGPGRFTGIRISLTFASMMQFLNKTQVRGATMFEVLARQAETSVQGDITVKLKRAQVVDRPFLPSGSDKHLHPLRPQRSQSLHG